MKIVPGEQFQKELLKIGRKDLAAGFDVDESHYLKLLHECRRSHPEYSEEKRHHWAAYSAATLPESPKAPFFTESFFLWAWRVAVLLTLLVIAASRFFR